MVASTDFIDSTSAFIGGLKPEIERLSFHYGVDIVAENFTAKIRSSIRPELFVRIEWVMHEGYISRYWVMTLAENGRAHWIKHYVELDSALRSAHHALELVSDEYNPTIPQELVEEYRIDLAFKELHLAGYSTFPGVFGAKARTGDIIRLSWEVGPCSQRWHVKGYRNYGYVDSVVSHYSYYTFDEAWDKLRDMAEHGAYYR